MATTEDTIIATVLGSCVAVALFDEEAGIGGLNHFMLPGFGGGVDLVRSPNAKYGMYAMELLINDLMKLGARKASLKSKVFGGGSVLRFAKGGGSRIPVDNVDFAFEYLKKEGIPVLASDVGGLEPRKIFFYARTGRVLLKRVAAILMEKAARDEDRYIEDLVEAKNAGTLDGSVVLFDRSPKG
jgi:chemotaxis protein CheD